MRQPKRKKSRLKQAKEELEVLQTKRELEERKARRDSEQENKEPPKLEIVKSDKQYLER